MLASVLLLAAALPAVALAQTASSSASAAYQYKRQGIFDCGGAPQRGVTSPGGGAYVPVADATVEQNTGFTLNNTDILVYKECVLRELVDRERENAMSSYLQRQVIAVQRGRNGNPQYVVNYASEELQNVSDPAFLTYLQNGTLNNLNSAFQQQVTRTIARRYENETRNIGSALACPFTGDLKSLQNGTLAFNFTDFLAAANPQCDPINAAYIAVDIGNSRIALAREYQRMQWDAGRGYYSLTDNAQDPLAQKIYTPSATVQQSFQTMLDSPVRQLESANDVGQMISALYAGVTSQIISDSQGIAGLTQSVGGRPSYLSQLVSESAQGVRNAATNAALQVLNSARQVEASYYQAVNGVAGLLANAITGLRSAENQCWNAIIPRVCEGSALSADNTCIASSTTYKIATSTAFSDAVVNGQIQPLATVANKNVQTSQRALTLLDNLILGVTNTSSLDAQRLALQQLDSLIAQKSLHTQADLTAVTQQYTAAQSAMQTLLQDTVDAWRNSTDPNTGWCNVDNATVIAAWKARWQQ